MTSGAAVTNATSRLRQVLPSSGALDARVWERRHRGIVLLLLAHALGIFAYALALGNSWSISLLDGGIVGLFAVLAAGVKGTRPLRAGLAALGLFAASALIVNLSHGVIEMHFHFFFVVAMLSLYHEWVPFGLGILFVSVYYGALGLTTPETVFNDAGANGRPWLWVAIHGAFFIGASAASLMAWRQSEATHAKAEETSRRLSAEQLRQKQALEINDNVVQGLAVAMYSLDAGDEEFAREALRGTLVSARQIVTELLEDPDKDISVGPGDLIRLDPAVVVAPTE